MSRVNRMQGGSQNPAKMFFQWKSQHQKFCYYDKAEKENFFVEMPFKFLALSRYKTIKGWNQKKEGAIISNEVKDLKDEILVKFYPKNGESFEIARGPWSDIKKTVENWGGRYTESVYIMMENGDVANLQISGAALSTWFEFQKNQTDRFFDNFVEVNSYKDGQQGAVKYTYPAFEWGSSLNESFQKLAEAADVKIEEYEKSYFAKNEPKENFRERSIVDRYDMNRAKAPVPPSEVDAALAMQEAIDWEEELEF